MTKRSEGIPVQRFHSSAFPPSFLQLRKRCHIIHAASLLQSVWVMTSRRWIAAVDAPPALTLTGPGRARETGLRVGATCPATRQPRCRRSRRR